MKHLIVGTAGHVDHGKTALIKYLTGTDTDRLKEEKRRGISIDIGFASLSCGGDLILGIVDVPGHERFLKNMLAGTGGIDLALLIIAADEGIMPQTREHFEMLESFGITKGIVVITKIDKVETEWVDMVEEEIGSFLKHTFWETAPICRVSSATGAGIENLRQVLQEEALKIEERDRTAPFRLWIDRAFNLKGHGLIVTGSVLSGSVKNGDTVVIEPASSPARIREMESHNQSVSEVGAGQRASFKLSGVVLSEVDRGMVLSEPGYGQKSQAWEAMLHWRTRFPSGTRIRFHIGTGEFIGRMVYFDSSEEEKETLIRLYLEKPIVAALGDRGLLRRYSPQNLIGGLLLLCPLERSGRKKGQVLSLAKGVKLNDRASLLYDLLLMAKEPLTLAEWAPQAGYINKSEVESAVKSLMAKGKVSQFGIYYTTTDNITARQEAIIQQLTAYHRLKPNEPGMSRESIRQKLHISGGFAEWILQVAARKGQIKLDGEYLSLPSHANKHGQGREDLLKKFESVMATQDLMEVTPEGLAEKMQRPLEEIKPFFDGLVKEKVLLRLTGVHVYSKTIQYIGEVIQRHFQDHKTLSVSEFRDAMSTSRRLAIPVLEYFDLHKITNATEETLDYPGLI